MARYDTARRGGVVGHLGASCDARARLHTANAHGHGRAPHPSCPRIWAARPRHVGALPGPADPV